MAFDLELAERIRQVLARRKGITEKKMFGGLVFFLKGNILVGVWKHSLIVRLGSTETTAALTEPHVRPFDVTGKAMKGWALVEPAGLIEEDVLADWIARSLAFVRTLPGKNEGEK